MSLFVNLPRNNGHLETWKPKEMPPIFFREDKELIAQVIAEKARLKAEADLRDKEVQKNLSAYKGN